MMDENHLTELDMSEIVYDTDQLFSENQSSDNFETNLEELNSGEQLDSVSERQTNPIVEKKSPPQKNEITRTTKLPMARIKNIMKMDPDVSIVSADAVFLVTKATVSIDYRNR